VEFRIALGRYAPLSPIKRWFNFINFRQRSLYVILQPLPSLSTFELSVPFGDGCNPSPSGEERVGDVPKGQANMRVLNNFLFRHSGQAKRDPESGKYLRIPDAGSRSA
jgi:hypothetical protein